MFSVLPRPCSMIDWRWRQTFDSSSMPRRCDQHLGVVGMSERVIVAHLGYHQPVADVVRPAWNSSFFSCSKISGSKYQDTGSCGRLGRRA